MKDKREILFLNYCSNLYCLEITDLTKNTPAYSQKLRNDLNRFTKTLEDKISCEKIIEKIFEVSEKEAQQVIEGLHIIIKGMCSMDAQQVINVSESIKRGEQIIKYQK